MRVGALVDCCGLQPLAAAASGSLFFETTVHHHSWAFHESETHGSQQWSWSFCLCNIDLFRTPTICTYHHIPPAYEVPGCTFSLKSPFSALTHSPPVANADAPACSSTCSSALPVKAESVIHNPPPPPPPPPFEIAISRAARSSREAARKRMESSSLSELSDDGVAGTPARTLTSKHGGGLRRNIDDRQERHHVPHLRWAKKCVHSEADT